MHTTYLVFYLWKKIHKLYLSIHFAYMWYFVSVCHKKSWYSTLKFDKILNGSRGLNNSASQNLFFISFTERDVIINRKLLKTVILKNKWPCKASYSYNRSLLNFLKFQFLFLTWFPQSFGVSFSSQLSWRSSVPQSFHLSGCTKSPSRSHWSNQCNVHGNIAHSDWLPGRHQTTTLHHSTDHSFPRCTDRYLCQQCWNVCRCGCSAYCSSERCQHHQSTHGLSDDTWKRGCVIWGDHVVKYYLKAL